MELNWIEMLIHAFNTLVLFGILRWLVYKPVVKFMRTRSDKLNQQQDDAEQALTKARAMMADAAKKLEDAQKQADEIIHSSTEHARVRGDEIVSQAHLEADEAIERARKELEKEKKYALQSMREDIVDLSVRMASKVLRRELRKEDNEKLVGEFFEKVN
jgi:F-type H+-transporting ATPase subunit b